MLTLDDSERLYQGHLGYDDDIRTVYRFDNSVPNSSQVAAGDVAVIRGKSNVHGSAVVATIASEQGTKTRRRCPACGETNLKHRRTMSPQYRCQCGAEFESALIEEVKATQYTVNFGNSFISLAEDTDIRMLWSFAPRLNKQFSILELDTGKTQAFLAEAKSQSAFPDELPLAATAGIEGAHATVSVNRFERNDRLRQACINHYGSVCIVCGFDFARVFGNEGKGAIEVHHLNPLSDGNGSHMVDPIRDLRPLCSNCHTMAHRRRPPFTPEELATMLRDAQ